MKKIKLLLCLLICLCSITTAYATNTDRVVLSADELHYAKTQSVLRISLVENWKPFSYGTKQAGLPYAILERFSQATDITIEVVPAKSYKESLEQFAAGEVDIIGLYTTYSTIEAQPTHSSEIQIIPYLSAQAELVYHKNTKLNTLSTVTMADLNGRPPFTDNDNLSSIYYETPERCLNAVRSGQTDLAICDTFTGSALLQRYWAKDLISTPSTMRINFGFGVLDNTDPRLISALEQTISTFSGGDITRCLMEGVESGSGGFLDFAYQYPFELLCFFSALMFVIAIILLTYTKVNVRQHQSFQGYEESYRLLSDTFGEAGMEYDCRNDTLTIFGEHSNLDIEQKTNDFKEKLRHKSIRISLSDDELEQIIVDGAENNAFSAEFQCGVKSGEWVWYRLIYTVICTTESHRRPIRLVGCLANINAEHAEKERLMELSSNDQLTGLLNHATAEKRMRTLLESGSRNGILIVVDIDYFKHFNDNHGHLCGDDVLRNIGKAVRDTFSPADILCRWGGDEFLFFLSNEETIDRDFPELINVLRKKMNEYQYEKMSCPVTLSIGGAKSYPGSHFDVLFQQADDALYLAKKNGRDQFWLYAPTEQKPYNEVET